MRFHPQITHGDQALAFQPVIGHPGLGGQRSRQVPVAFATQRRQDSVPFARSEPHQISHLGPHLTPLFPVAHAHPSAQPLIQFGDRAVVVRDTEVAHPTTDVPGELVEPIAHRDTPAASGQLAEVMPKVLEGPLRPAQLGSSKAKTEKLTDTGLYDSALVLIHHQSETLGQEASDACQDPLTRPGAFDQDQQV